MAFTSCTTSCSRTLLRLAAKAQSTAACSSSSTASRHLSALAASSRDPRKNRNVTKGSSILRVSASLRVAGRPSCDSDASSPFHAPHSNPRDVAWWSKSGSSKRYLHTSPVAQLTVRSTEASSTPPETKHEREVAARERYKRDQGQLTFVRTSLFKLSLPLDPPSDPSIPYFSDPASAYEEDESPETVSSHRTKRQQEKLPKRKHPKEQEKEVELAREKERGEGKGNKEEEDQNWEAVERKHSRSKDQKELLQMGKSARAPGDDDFDVDSPSLRASQDQHQQQQAQSSTTEVASAPSSSGTAPVSSSAAEVHSVLFLLHAAQPLSYIANLIRAESPSARPSMRQKVEEVEADASKFVERGGKQEEALRSEAVRERSSEAKKAINDVEAQTHSERVWATLGSPPSITFLTRASDGKRWSPATAIGDFLREAARVGSFVIRIGARDVEISVPSFEDRTRFLRGRLYATTEEVEEMAGVKRLCDAEAHRVTRRWAYGGVGLLTTWWLAVTVLTFATPLGWDRMEPVTYLTGLATVIAGYVFVLHRNRDASYRAVLSETTTRRQQVLYEQHGFDPSRYAELIEIARGLRKTIKAVAEEYDLEWEQGETRAGKMTQRALEIIRKEEARKNQGRIAKKEAEEDEEEEERKEAEEAEKEKDDGDQPAKDADPNNNNSTKSSSS